MVLIFRCCKTLNNNNGAVAHISHNITKCAFCALDSVLYQISPHLILTPTLSGRDIIISDVQMTKLRLREAKQLLKNHSK